MTSYVKKRFFFCSCFFLFFYFLLFFYAFLLDKSKQVCFKYKAWSVASNRVNILNMTVGDRMILLNFHFYL